MLVQEFIENQLKKEFPSNDFKVIFIDSKYGNLYEIIINNKNTNIGVYLFYNPHSHIGSKYLGLTNSSLNNILKFLIVI